jgi:hypothetical protein
MEREIRLSKLLLSYPQPGTEKNKIKLSTWLYQHYLWFARNQIK